MEESSKNVSPVDTGIGDERKLDVRSLCKDTNATTTTITTLKGEPGMMPFSQCPKNTVPIPSSDFHDLAELYWKYPTVHQTFVVSPGLHTNQALLAKARRKSERLKKESEKEPERHRVSHEAFSNTQNNRGSRKTAAEINRTDSRKSRVVMAAKAPVQQRRRTVNMSIVPQNNKNVNVNRRLTLQPVNRNRKDSQRQKTADPGAALAEFRTSQGLSKTNTTSDKTPVYSETPVVLDALREQREDLEKREEEINQSSKLFNLTKFNQTCCGVCRKCVGSYRVTCVAFFVFVTIIIILCVVAIAYPIIKAIMLRREGRQTKN